MNKNNKKILVGSMCAVLLLGSLGTLIGISSKGFKDWNTNNWGNNLQDVFNKKDATKEKVEELDVDSTSTESTYVLPETMSFGKEEAQAVVATENKNTAKVSTSSTIVKSNSKIIRMANESGATLSTVNVVAYLTPNNADIDNVEWTVSWSNMNSTWATGKTVSDYLSVAKGEGLNAVVSCKQAFSEPIVLKVKVNKAEISVADTCICNYYKKLTSLDLALTANVEDKILSAGDMFTYAVNENFADGTLDLNDSTAYVNSFATSSTLDDVVTINEDFTKYKLAAFDYDVFYGISSKFSFVDTSLVTTSGKGRNTANNALEASTGDINFKVSKGSIVSNVVAFDIQKETVIYPESVVIGDGSDITL